MWLRNAHIPEYRHGSWTNHEPRRNRKLLLHRRQIDTLVGKIREGNFALVPLSLYFAEGKVRLSLRWPEASKPATNARTWPVVMPSVKCSASWVGALRA